MVRNGYKSRTAFNTVLLINWISKFDLTDKRKEFRTYPSYFELTCLALHYCYRSVSGYYIKSLHKLNVEEETLFDDVSKTAAINGDSRYSIPKMYMEIMVLSAAAVFEKFDTKELTNEINARFDYYNSLHPNTGTIHDRFFIQYFASIRSDQITPFNPNQPVSIVGIQQRLEFEVGLSVFLTDLLAKEYGEKHLIPDYYDFYKESK